MSGREGPPDRPFLRDGAPDNPCLPFQSVLQNRGFGLYSKLRSEFLKLRRWSLGLRRWT